MSRLSILTLTALASATALVTPAGASDARAARGEEKLAKMLAGRVAGKPVDCLQLRNIQSSRIVDGTAIVYDMGRTLYVNRPENGGSSLDDDDIMVTNTYSSQLCSIDTVRMIDRGSQMFSGVVFLGKFVPYTKVAKAD